jgi:hypothetical protein
MDDAPQLESELEEQLERFRQNWLQEVQGGQEQAMQGAPVGADLYARAEVYEQ